MNEEGTDSAVSPLGFVSGDWKDPNGASWEGQPPLPRKLPVQWGGDNHLSDDLQCKAVPELGAAVLPPGCQCHS